MNRTIIFNGINGYERYGLLIDTVQISPPLKKDYRQQLPFFNGSYNMSKTFGVPTYENRSIVYTAQFIENDSKSLEDKITHISNWLYGPVEAILQDTALDHYYYIAECTSIAVTEDAEYGELTITFSAYPFKIKKETVGEYKWDNINFELDVFEQTEFTCRNSDYIILNNKGAGAVYATYTADAAAILTIDGISQELTSAGTTIFLLMPGDNKIQVTTEDTVNLSFDWRLEMP